jgi:hypothetical protein
MITGNTVPTALQISNTLTSYLTSSGATHLYQRTNSMVSYITDNTLSSYLTSSGATHLYATKNNPIFTGLTAIHAGTQPALSLRATADGDPAELRFGRLASGALDAADWYIGYEARSAGTRNFGIGNQNKGLVIKIDGIFGSTTFNYPVNIANTLTINDRPVATKFWVSGRFNGRTTPGPVTPVADIGQFTATITRSDTKGQYNLSWSASHPLGDKYVMMVTLVAGLPVWFTTSATTAIISCYTPNGQQIDPEWPSDVYFVVY